MSTTLTQDLHIRWLGVAGLELISHGQVLLIDPYLTRVPFRKQWFGRISSNQPLISSIITKSNYILVTHPHWDHLMDVPYIARITDSIVFGSENTRKILEICGVPGDRIRITENEKTFHIGNYAVKATLAEHGKAPGFLPGELKPGLKYPLTARDYRMDENYSFAIECDGIRIVTDPGMMPANLPPAEILAVSPKYTQAYYKHIIETVKLRVIIPIHWDNMWRPLSRPLVPMYQPPSFSSPFKRYNLIEFSRTISRISPEAKVFLPEVLKYYDVKEVLE